MTDDSLRTAEAKARDLLTRLDIPDAEARSSGDLVELANLIADYDRLRRLLFNLTTGDGAQIEDLNMSRQEWETHAKECGMDGDLEVIVTFSTWMKAVDAANALVAEWRARND